MPVKRDVSFADIASAFPRRRFRPRRHIPKVCDRISELRGREVVPAPFDSREHPLLSCSVSGFCVRTDTRDYLGYPIDASDTYMAVVFVHELWHCVRDHQGLAIRTTALAETAAPTLHAMGAREAIRDILGRSQQFNDRQEREAEGFALDFVAQLTAGIERMDPSADRLNRIVRGAFADPFGQVDPEGV